MDGGIKLMTKFDTNFKPKKTTIGSNPDWWKKILLGCGVASILLSVLIAGFSIYEAVLGGGKIQMVKLPGFHEVKLDSAGLYVGLYQHRSNAPLPAEQLSKMDVRLLSKDDYQEVPVVMNLAGQIINRFGIQGMPLFNFVVESPGEYTISGIYSGDVKGPTVPVMLIPQAAQNIKQTLIVGIAFFATFLGLGIFLIVKRNRWTARPPSIG